MKQKGKEIRSSTSSHSSQSAREGGNEEEPHSGGSSSGEEPLRHPRRGRRHYSNPNDIRVEVPEFEGELDPDEFLEWLQIVERVFEHKGIPEDKKVKLIAPKLRKFASLWWTNLLVKRARQGKEKIRTWDKMKSKLKARFLPPTYLHKNYSQPHHLTQAFTTLDEATIVAHKVESPRKAKLKREIPRPTQRTYLPPRDEPPTNTKPIPNPMISSSPKPNFPKPPPNPQERSRCYKCQGLGHIASECPNRRVVTLREFQEFKEAEMEEEEENEKAVHLMDCEEECIEQADERELLVLRRAPSDQEAPNPSGQEAEEVVYAEEGDILELKPLLSIQKCTFNPYFETNTALSSTENESVTPNRMELRPYHIKHHPMNLRANSFLEGENDVSMGGLIDQIKKDSSQQESKAKNELYKAPRAVRKAVEAPGLLFVFDPGKGQL